MFGSAIGKFAVEDLSAVLKGAGLAAIGVAGAAVTQFMSTGEFDIQTTGWLAVAAFFSVLANGFRKFATDTR